MDKEELLKRPCMSHVEKEIEGYIELLVSIPDVKSKTEIELNSLLQTEVSTKDCNKYYEAYESLEGAKAIAPKSVHPLKKAVISDEVKIDKVVLFIHVIGSDYFKFNEKMSEAFKEAQTFVPFMVKPTRMELNSFKSIK